MSDQTTDTNLNIIHKIGNPSFGLGFLEMRFSGGKTKADAIAAAIGR